MSEPINWGKEVEESEAAYTKHIEQVLDRPRQIKEEKRAVSEVAVKKGLPLGITRKFGEYIGKSTGGKKRKTRRGGKKKKTHRSKHRK
jgi:hypothetical protein